MTKEEAAKSTASPESALPALERFVELSPNLENDKESLVPLAHLAAGSRQLSQWLFRRPEDIEWLTEKGLLQKSRSGEEMRSALTEIMNAMPTDPMKVLRVFKHRELCRICARELSGLADVGETLAEWSAVADIATGAAIDFATKKAVAANGKAFFTPQEGGDEQEASFSAIAMGKLGGSELNISSDIDIIFVHSSDNGRTESEKISLHEYFVRIARETNRLLNDRTEDGFVFRVDLDLRPEGRSGELTNSIGAMEIYYESWGRAWERQALIKARHCGGNEEVTREIFDRLKPFVYRKYMDASAIGEIAGMKEKIDIGLKSKKGAKKAKSDIKLGVGGIREIEFIIQSIQLLYGAHYPELKIRPTLSALGVASSLGLLSEPHHRDLEKAYIFYRRIENRIQYMDGLQTHNIPESEESRDILARQMGIEDQSPGKKLLELVATSRERVRSIFDLFFKKDEQEAKTPSALFADLSATTEWLDSIYFDRPEETANLLQILRNGKAFGHASEKSRRLFDDFGPKLVDEAAKTSWPDYAIIGFEKFVEARPDRDMLYGLLNTHRPLIRLLTALFSSSESLTQILIRQPDLFDRFIGAELLGKPPERSVYTDEFLVAVSSEQSVEEKLAEINAIRSAKLLRLGLSRILDLTDRFEVMEALTILAEEYIKALLPLSIERTAESTFSAVDPSSVKWVMLAGGKLGRREMNFGSDIDMVVFTEGEPAPYAIRVAQNMGSLAKTITPYGAGYEIDYRLRPDGEKGPLAPSYLSMVEYYKTRAEAWERLALVGVRPVAGDETLAKKVMDAIDKFVYGTPLTGAEIDRIANIRERIIAEKVRKGACDIKFGRGGLIEIEFICQILTMENRDVATSWQKDKPFTIATLELAKKNKWLDRATCVSLEKAYNIYRSIEDALRMDKTQSVNVAPKEGPELTRIARRAAIPEVGPERFVETLDETMLFVRSTYEAFMKERGAG